MTPQENVDEVNRKLIALLNVCGLTLEGISAQSDVSQQALTRYMKQELKSGGSLLTVCALAHVAGVKVTLEVIQPKGT
jgi:hypothetical protein